MAAVVPQQAMEIRKTKKMIPTAKYQKWHFRGQLLSAQKGLVAWNILRYADQNYLSAYFHFCFIGCDRSYDFSSEHNFDRGGAIIMFSKAFVASGETHFLSSVYHTKTIAW